ncbi:hypothetical protein [Ornithinimicrobium tianjinense]|uniref:Uncharacterized protein n=1 Tax=Ornithinimicrobium tianjinense TaxID=1195761 RepID=A0A917F2C1_9MICO|nr:hypothetical protein [Ornithinimicrobium tianjinense]GGF43284.1 hypothetical protein GCM10011366_08930 [Ornithinimicrobium tianjinense]
MSETTNTPDHDDAEGTYVGGGFGRPDDGGTAAPDELSTAEEMAAAQAAGDEEALTAAPAEVEEYVTAAGSEAPPSDVEGTSTEPAPGERNEPV